MMTCYLWDIKIFLMYRTLCKSILKCRFRTKVIELTRFVLSEALGVPQLWDAWCRPFRSVGYEDLQNTSEAMEKEILACLIIWWGFVFLLKIGYFPVLDGISPCWWKHSGSQASLYCVQREEVIVFSWCCRGLSLIERKLKKWILSMKSSCILR